MPVITATDIVCAQYNRSYGGYPYSPDSVYIANREMMPQSAFFPPPTNPANTPAKPQTTNQTTTNSETPAASVIPNNSTAPFIPQKNVDSENNKEQTKTTQESPINKVKSYFASLFHSSKNNKSSQESTDKESLENIDDGQETIEALRKEQDYSVPDYVNSATQSNAATAKNHYKQGLDFEVQGNLAEAVRSYNAFITANKKQTTNGTLAAPYHRLALIAWKQSEIRNAGIYFRYAMKYALGGNVPIIAGDYALFLIEQDNLKQAEVILRNALIHHPENNRLIYYLGRCTAQQDKPIEALRYFSASLGEERAYQELVFLYRQRGDFERADFLDTKRNEYIAGRNKNIPQQVFAAQPKNVQQPVPAAAPTTPPPVIPNSHGILSQGTIGTPLPLPLPSFDNPNRQSVQVFTNTNNSEMLSPQGNRTVPEDSWQPLNPPPVPTSASPMPVSKVFHYPADHTVPTYYEFQGEQYPKSTKNTNPVDTNVVQTSFVP
ncbi:MAG: tetratricopeptide repeat protein [Planctomycetaceae bacterium]|nr:tetratricopeptide repeat protein [Planctomycetaceae bacterium]